MISKTVTRTTGIVLTLGALAGAIIVACGSGDDGAPGGPGATGAAGPAGPAGPAGTPGAGVDGGGVLSGACTQPCHTFGGVVDQWRFSNHSHPQNTEIGGGSCGNCHGIDGLQQRVANKYVVSADAGAPSNVAQGHINYKAANGSISEIGYGGATTIGRIHCSTCHDFNPTTDPHVTGKYTAGQARIRVPGGAADTAFIEKSPDASAPTGQALSYKSGNVCVFCHKSRKDVSSYISTTANTSITSYRWGPHDGPQADVYSGKGGYHFSFAPGYGTSAHVTVANACVSCHMQPVAANANVPDHTMKPALAYCKTCHTTYTGTTYDIQGGRSAVTKALFELQAALDGAGYLTRSEASPYPQLSDDDKADGQFQHDLARPGNSLTPDQAGALYNYLIIARSKDLGIHNPTYTKQLLWDSIIAITGNPPQNSLSARPN